MNNASTPVSTATSAHAAEAIPDRRVFSPAVDIAENQDELLVYADLPGVKEEDLRITFEKHVLTIEADVAPTERPSFQLVHREYHEGTFRRVFTVSDDIDHSKISATLKDGVLKLVLPKSEPAKPRMITVNSA